jgi:hypothetical protein
MIWSSLVLSICLGIVSCVYCYYKYDALLEDPQAQASFVEVGERRELNMILWLVQ